MLTKYGATIVGYSILAKPSMNLISNAGNNDSASITEITGNYIRNGSLMVNLTKAIGRIVVSYKDVQKIIGFTSLLNETKSVLDDLD